MKLTQADREKLRSWGFADGDIPQIEEALHKSKTKYRLGSVVISRERAISELGRDAFLSGISRSAFHYTACRNTPTGENVYFDSSNLFK